MRTDDMKHTVYPAALEFDGGEMEVSETKEGVPYIVFRDVTVDTGYEIQQRTVMAFGEAMERVRELRTPGVRITVDVFDSGRVIKVDGEAAKAT